MPRYYIRRLLVDMLDNCGMHLFVRAWKMEVVSSGFGSPYGQ